MTSPTRQLLAIEIGGTKLQLVTGSGDGRIVGSHRLDVEPGSGADHIRQRLTDAITRLKPQFHWQAVGVGYGGPVDVRTGTICRSFQVDGWSGFPLADWLRELIGVPVVVENDTNTAALGESRLGAGRGFSPVFYTNSGSGVGGGLVLNRRIYHGATPGESEIGHLRLDRSGTIVEDRCSGWAVDRRMRELRTDGPESVLVSRLPNQPGGEARLLPAALAQHDPHAQRIIDDVAADLALALSHVVHLFHPEVIVLGGGLALIGEPWRTAIADALPKMLMGGFAPGPEVRLSELGENVVPIGALQLASEIHTPD